MNRIALVVHDSKPRAAEAAASLSAACSRSGVEAIIVAADTLPEGIDAVVGVGGDGTVLRAAGLALEDEIPVAGINVGRVGYLAEFAIDEIDAFVDALSNSRLRVFTAMTVSVRGPGFEASGINKREDDAKGIENAPITPYSAISFVLLVSYSTL